MDIRQQFFVLYHIYSIFAAKIDGDRGNGNVPFFHSKKNSLAQV